MAKLLFSSRDRDEAHRRLDELLGCSGHAPDEHDPDCPLHGGDERDRPKLPPFECREDPNADQPFQVWDPEVSS